MSVVYSAGVFVHVLILFICCENLFVEQVDKTVEKSFHTQHEYENNVNCKIRPLQSHTTRPKEYCI